MTREEILSMSAGKELDELVAEKVMGWERTGQCWKDERGNTRTIELTSFGSFEPSTDITAAWEVVELIGKDYGVEVYHEDGLSECAVGSLHKPEIVRVEALTAPEAICKAALLAVMKE